MSDVPLGELIKPARTVRAGAGNFPLLSMTMHEGLIDQSSRFKKQIASRDMSSYKVVERGQLVVGFPIDEGVLDFQTRYPAAIVSPAYGVWDLVDEARVDKRYLKRALRSERSFSYYRTRLRGSTARRRSLPADVFLALPIHLPPVEEQRRIGAILDQADAVRTKRRQVLAHLDALVQCTFFAMFGDGSGVSTCHFRDVVADLEGGKSLVAHDSSAATRNRVLKISAVTSNRFIPGESKALPDEYEPPEAHFVRKGDLLFSRANTTDLVGAVALVEEEHSNLVLPDKLWRFVWRDPEAVDPVYVWALFQTPMMRRAISSRSSGTGGSMKNISKAKLQDMPLPWPALPRQREFASRASVITKARSVVERALGADEELFASLQSRAFRGEL